MPKRDSGACGKNKDLVLHLDSLGFSLSEIGRRIGTTKRMVRHFLRRNGVTRVFPCSWKGERCGQWKGGRIVDKDGYTLVHCPGHPNARNPGKVYVLEHRLVMEKYLGRYLNKGEVVHHVNGQKSDNRIENLELFSSNDLHLRHELTGRIPNWSEEGKRRIREGVIRGAVRRRLKKLRSRNKLDAGRSP